MRKSQIIPYMAVLAFVTLVTLLVHRGLGPVPPILRLLSPFEGIWVSGEPRSFQNRDFEVLGLRERVTIWWDSNSVPHIVAQNDEDLYFAQGYLHAKERLWQMEVQAKAGNGRLAEFFGKAAAEFDKQMILFGLRQAQQVIVQEMEKDPETVVVLNAYVEGVNAYIRSLKYNEYPIEFKFHGLRPELWTREKIAAFLVLMKYRLTGYSQDLDLTVLARKQGVAKVLEIFPRFQRGHQPIVSKQELSKTITSRGSPMKMIGPDPFMSSLQKFPDYFQPPAGQGSNSWVIGPEKSVTGEVIVANDTHLGLSLPAAWFEVQLTTPTQSVYGASFPGSPAIMIGFNSNIAWAMTNATSDTLDWYEVEFKDPSHYEFDKKLLPVKILKEKIAVRNGLDEEIETKWTHQGILVHEETQGPRHLGLVLQWSAQKASNPISNFLKLNKSKSYKDCRAAIRTYSAPPQNIICADAKNYSITHQGKFLKRKINQGRFVLNGRTSQSDWKQWIPDEELPAAENPAKGYFESANQNPVDEGYPYDLGWQYDDSFRARRISGLIEKAGRLSAEDMMAFQNDDIDLLSREVLQLALSNITFKDQKSSSFQIQQKLKKWNHKISTQRWEPIFFEYFWKQVQWHFWSEDLKIENRVIFPPRQTTVNRLRENRSSDRVLITNAFENSIQKMEKDFGSNFEKLKWGERFPLRLQHISKNPLFSQSIPVNGSSTTVNVHRDHSHGAAWRMVVQLGEIQRAYTSLPGGSSGNPLSRRYANGVQSWVNGEFKKVVFLGHPADVNLYLESDLRAQWKLTPQKLEDKHTEHP